MPDDPNRNPTPCAPTNGRPGYPFGFLGAGGRLPKAQRGQVFIVQYNNNNNSGGYNPPKKRPWLGLVDLSRAPSDTFFREAHPALEMRYKHRQNRLFRMCVIWPQKHDFFYGSSESESAFFLVYRRPQGIYADHTSKLQREQTTGPPPF